MKTKSEVQDEALKPLLRVNRGGAAITTGGGKTLLGLRHMEANYSEFATFLVVASKKSIHKEWIAQAIEHGLGYLVDHMTFSTYLSLPKQDTQYDVVYLDECHSLLETHEPWLDSYKGKILGLTGTKPRHTKSAKGRMVSKFCPIIYEYKTDEAVKDKVINDYLIMVYMLNLDTRKNILMQNKDKTKSWYSSEKAIYDYWTNRIEEAISVKELQIMRVMRMKAMMTFPSKEDLAKALLCEIEDKVLLFANTQEQADKFGIASYHSNNPKSDENLEKFKKGIITELAAVLQLSEGINVPDLKEGLLLHAYGNERKAAQRIGRLMRLNPNDRAIIRVLCYRDTVDVTWVKSALEGFDQTKIIYKH